MTLSVFYYDVLLVLGLVISYEDWKTRKIRNLWILLGLILCSAGYAYLFANSLLGHWKMKWVGIGEFYLPWTFYPMALGHFVLIVGAGLLTWRMRLWPAGDAKLYIVFGLLLALIDHNVRGFPFLVFLKLLINIFVPAGLWVLATVLLGAAASVPSIRWKTLQRETAAAYDRARVRIRDIWPYRYGFAAYVINVFLLFFVLDLLQSRFAALAFLRGPWGQMALLVAVYLLWKPMSALAQGRRFWKLGLAILLWWVFDPNLRRIDLIEALRQTMYAVLIFCFLLGFIRSAVTLFLRSENSENIAPKDLRPGMILSDRAWETLRDFGRDKKEEAPGRYADGLFLEDIQRIQSWQDLPDFAVTVYRATPFAIWVFYGTLLTLALPKNVVYWIFRVCYDPSGAINSFLRLWGT